MKERKISILKQMLHLQQKQLRKSVRICDSDVILVLCERLHIVLLGHARVKVRSWEKYRHKFKSFLKKKSSIDKRRALFQIIIKLVLSIWVTNLNCWRIFLYSQKSIYERAAVFLTNSKWSQGSAYRFLIFLFNRMRPKENTKTENQETLDTRETTDLTELSK